MKLEGIHKLVQILMGASVLALLACYLYFLSILS